MIILQFRVACRDGSNAPSAGLEADLHCSHARHHKNQSTRQGCDGARAQAVAHAPTHTKPTVFAIFFGVNPRRHRRFRPGLRPRPWCHHRRWQPTPAARSPHKAREEKWLGAWCACGDGRGFRHWCSTTTLAVAPAFSRCTRALRCDCSTIVSRLYGTRQAAVTAGKLEILDSGSAGRRQQQGIQSGAQCQTVVATQQSTTQQSTAQQWATHSQQSTRPFTRRSLDGVSPRQEMTLDRVALKYVFACMPCVEVHVCTAAAPR